MHTHIFKAAEGLAGLTRDELVWTSFSVGHGELTQDLGRFLGLRLETVRYGSVDHGAEFQMVDQ